MGWGGKDVGKCTIWRESDGARAGEVIAIGYQEGSYK